MLDYVRIQETSLTGPRGSKDSGRQQLDNSDEKDLLDDIVSGFLSGNTQPYELLSRRIRQYVVQQYYGDALNRDDIVSDVMGALYRNLKAGSFRGDSLEALEAYIFGIVKFTIRNRRRKSGRLQFPANVPEPESGHLSGIDDRLAREDMSQKILDAMDENCRQLLEMKFRSFMSDQEIAEQLGKTKNAVSTAISRCLKKAKDLDFVEY